MKKIVCLLKIQEETWPLFNKVSKNRCNSLNKYLQHKAGFGWPRPLSSDSAPCFLTHQSSAHWKKHNSYVAAACESMTTCSAPDTPPHCVSTPEPPLTPQGSSRSFTVLLKAVMMSSGHSLTLFLFFFSCSSSSSSLFAFRSRWAPCESTLTVTRTHLTMKNQE